jgi:hypothetical protein
MDSVTACSCRVESTRQSGEFLVFFQETILSATFTCVLRPYLVTEDNARSAPSAIWSQS